jgi:molecular chaperone HtpG
MSTVEKHHFQAEIQQLLDIVVHSLYTDKEIFVRELISNAADACEKLRFLQTAGQAPQEPELPLTMSLSTDDKAHTITIADSGIGMTHGELVENLGTIAHSGSKAFLKQIAENKKPDASLIGQFGVGFYSAFMVAKNVTVFSRSYAPDQPGWKWTSDGSGTYELEPAPDVPCGTKVVVSLKDEDKEFAQAHRIESVIKRYSNFVPFPIELNGKT